jgi:hypothetical protein
MALQSSVAPVQLFVLLFKRFQSASTSPRQLHAQQLDGSGAHELDAVSEPTFERMQYSVAALHVSPLQSNGPEPIVAPPEPEPAVQLPPEITSAFSPHVYDWPLTQSVVPQASDFETPLNVMSQAQLSTLPSAAQPVPIAKMKQIASTRMCLDVAPCMPTASERYCSRRDG